MKGHRHAKRSRLSQQRPRATGHQNRPKNGRGNERWQPVAIHPECRCQFFFGHQDPRDVYSGLALYTTARICTRKPWASISGRNEVIGGLRSAAAECAVCAIHIERRISAAPCIGVSYPTAVGSERTERHRCCAKTPAPTPARGCPHPPAYRPCRRATY